MTSPQDHDLQRCLLALRAGDQAFLTTLVLRHGGRIARVLTDAGVSADDAEALVHEVAFAVADRIDTRDDELGPWEFVLTVVAAVLDEALDGPDDDPATRAHPSADGSPEVGSKATTGRTVHLVDLDNLVCGPWADRQQVLAAWRFYQRLADVRPDDHVEVAAEAALWKKVAFDLDPSVRFRPGRGPDGADRVLLASVTPEWIATRFDRLVIASGDGAFAELATEVAELGVQVTVIAVPGTLSKRLRAAASEVTWMPAPGSVNAQVERQTAPRTAAFTPGALRLTAGAIRAGLAIELLTTRADQAA